MFTYINKEFIDFTYGLSWIPTAYFVELGSFDSHAYSMQLKHLYKKLIEKHYNFIFYGNFEEDSLNWLFSRLIVAGCNVTHIFNLAGKAPEYSCTDRIGVISDVKTAKYGKFGDLREEDKLLLTPDNFQDLEKMAKLLIKNGVKIQPFFSVEYVLDEEVLNKNILELVPFHGKIDAYTT